MSRGVGVARRLNDLLEPLEPLLAALTQLGDAWFLIALALALYWFGHRVPLSNWSRRRGLLVIAVMLLAFAATHTLKGLLALPRPIGADAPGHTIPGPLGALYGSAATATGFGFPSGHAVSAAAVYGTLAWVGDDRWHPRRLAAAGGLIVLVALTRIALGVHFLVDVVVGIVLGLALAAAALRLARHVQVLLVLAVSTAAVRLFLAVPGPRTAALIAAPLGVLLTRCGLGLPGEPAASTHQLRQLAVWVIGAAALLAAPLALRVWATTPSVALGAFGGATLATALPLAPRPGNW